MRLGPEPRIDVSSLKCLTSSVYRYLVIKGVDKPRVTAYGPKRSERIASTPVHHATAAGLECVRDVKPVHTFVAVLGRPLRPDHRNLSPESGDDALFAAVHSP